MLLVVVLVLVLSGDGDGVPNLALKGCELGEEKHHGDAWDGTPCKYLSPFGVSALSFARASFFSHFSLKADSYFIEIPKLLLSKVNQ